MMGDEQTPVGSRPGLSWRDLPAPAVLVIRGGRVIDPGTGRDEIADVVVEAGRVTRIGRDAGGSYAGAAGADAAGAGSTGGIQVIDARGQVVCPGLIDIHVHLREPGQEYKEDVASGTRAAARGGFTAVAAMPNTKPVTDSRALVEFIRAQAERGGAVRVYPIGSVTKASQGDELAPMGEMILGGAAAFSDDGQPVGKAELMRLALLYAAQFGKVVIDHCEEPSLAEGGVMHRGHVSDHLGLRGIPGAAEDVMVARNIILAAETGAHCHIAHLSTARSLELVRDAKRRGVPITCEVTPHHLTLTEDDLLEHPYDTRFKVNPPLRTADDVATLRQGLADGTVDCIATDHAPHQSDDKETDFAAAAFGMLGLETALGLVLTHLVQPGVITLPRAIELLTTGPARALNLAGGRLAEGAEADITVFDPKATWRVDPNEFASRSRNTPFTGWELTGRATHTIVAGRPVMQDGRLLV
ncbi:MAG: dihydroorotase [Symbiobacteriia bacterium]